MIQFKGGCFIFASSGSNRNIPHFENRCSRFLVFYEIWSTVTFFFFNLCDDNGLVLNSFWYTSFS